MKAKVQGEHRLGRHGEEMRPSAPHRSPMLCHRRGRTRACGGIPPAAGGPKRISAENPRAADPRRHPVEKETLPLLAGIGAFPWRRILRLLTSTIVFGHDASCCRIGRLRGPQTSPWSYGDQDANRQHGPADVGFPDGPARHTHRHAQHANADDDASSSPAPCPTPTGTSTSATWSNTSRPTSGCASRSCAATAASTSAPTTPTAPRS